MTIWSISPETRAILDGNGGIILDLHTGKFCGLNPTGAKIWLALQQSRGFATQASLVNTLQREFEIPRSDLECQVDRFLSNMESKTLMRKIETRKIETRKTETPNRGPGTPSIATREADDSSAEPISEFALGPPLPSNISDQAPSTEQSAGKPVAGHRVGVAVTLIGLIAAQSLLRFGGLRSLHRAVRKWPTRKRGKLPEIAISEVASMLNKAARFCPRRAWCLERAAVTVCLLRWRGLPAEFVIGCRRVPFASHAWAEVACTPVNEDQSVIALYSVIERC